MQIFSRIGRHGRQMLPLVHCEFSQTNGDVQPAVVLNRDSTFGQLGLEHLLVCILTTFNFGNESTSCLGKRSHTTSNKVFPPFVLLSVGTLGSFSGANADEDAHFSAWPFVYRRLFQQLWRGIVFPSALVDEDRLADLNWLEGKPNGGGCTAGLPDFAIELRRGLFSTVITSKED